MAQGWGSEEGHRAAVTYSGQRSGQRVVPKAKRKVQKEKTMQKALRCGRHWVIHEAVNMKNQQLFFEDSRSESNVQVRIVPIKPRRSVLDNASRKSKHKRAIVDFFSISLANMSSLVSVYPAQRAQVDPVTARCSLLLYQISAFISALFLASHRIAAQRIASQSLLSPPPSSHLPFSLTKRSVLYLPWLKQSPFRGLKAWPANLAQSTILSL